MEGESKVGGQVERRMMEEREKGMKNGRKRRSKMVRIKRRKGSRRGKRRLDRSEMEEEVGEERRAERWR